MVEVNTFLDPIDCMGAHPKQPPDTERQNLSMRMGMRRFTRLTNAFSKKVENLEHMTAMYFMHDNFCRIHQSLRVTPAMESGITGHVWESEEIVDML